MMQVIIKGAAVQGVVVWSCIHLVLLFFGAPLVAAHSWAIPALVAAIVLLDQRVCRESTFLANIGIGANVAPMAAGFIALVFEVALYSVVA